MSSKKNINVDVGRNSSLYFAIGLNIMLFLSWYGLNYKTYDKDLTSIDIVEMDEELEEDIPITTVTMTPPPPPPAPSEVITVVEDVAEIEETVIESTETSLDEKIEERIIDVSDVDVEELEEEVEVAFAVIENPPVFPGCEKVNKKDLKKCFSEKVLQHVKKNFKYPEAAQELGIQGRVSVYFIINSKGHVSGVRTRGPDQLLEKEAARIINSLPKMMPGQQRGKNVNVPYSIPIFFKLYQQ